MLGVSIFIAAVIAIVCVFGWCIQPRCPQCRSKVNYSQGEWDGIAFRKCNRCGCMWDEDY